MGFVIGLLTLLMVLDCVVLVLLVLVQLPKKEAGAGLAFGRSASDALFGAGSGNVLTKITKYAATVFFVMALLLSILQSKFHTRNISAFEQRLGQTRQPPNPTTPVPQSPATTPVTPTNSLNFQATATNMLSSPQSEATNLPAIPAAPTNPSPK